MTARCAICYGTHGPLVLAPDMLMYHADCLWPQDYGRDDQADDLERGRKLSEDVYERTRLL